MTRVTSVDAGQVITTGLVNLRRFSQRPTETLVLGELVSRRARLRPGSPGAALADTVAPVPDPRENPGTGIPVTLVDVAIERGQGREWQLCTAFVRLPDHRRFRCRGRTIVVDFADLTGLDVLEQPQGVAALLSGSERLKAADLAEVIHELSARRRVEVAIALDDERLADVLEELPEDDQVEILSGLGRARAADVLEAMQPDDAADLLSELPAEQAGALLDLMEPEDAEDVRRLLAYDENTAGGIMTPQPVILGARAAVAEALAHVRRADLPPALAAAVFVCRPPLEVPTGRYLGVVHLQRLLREPPHEEVANLLDRDVEALGPNDPLAVITRRMATYNLVSIPVTDEEGHLIGVVTVDDVLDHLLPEDWRD